MFAPLCSSPPDSPTLRALERTRAREEVSLLYSRLRRWVYLSKVSHSSLGRGAGPRRVYLPNLGFSTERGLAAALSPGVAVDAAIETPLGANGLAMAAAGLDGGGAWYGATVS